VATEEDVGGAHGESGVTRSPQTTERRGTLAGSPAAECSAVPYSPPAWAEIAPRWRELFEASPGASFFLSPDWVETWLDTFGATLRPSILRIDAGGENIGACLLVARTEWRRGFHLRRLYLNTAGEPADDSVCAEYNGLLARPGCDTAVAAALGRHLEGQEWDEFVVSGIPEEALASLQQALPWTSDVHWVTDYYVDLAHLRVAGVDYASVLSRNTREQLGRSTRLYRALGTLTVDAAEDTAAAETLLHELAFLHQAGWNARRQPGVFASARFVAFHEALIRRAFPRGAIQIIRVRAGHQPIGLIYCLVERRHAYFYQSGLRYGPDNRYKPGFVAHAAAIEYWGKRGLAEYNFMAGDGPRSRYKEALATGSRRLAWVTFRRPNVKMRLLGLLRAGKHALGSGHCASRPGPAIRSASGSASAGEIQNAYRDRRVAKQYVEERFASELNRLLHDGQVAALQALLHRARPARILEIAAGPGRLTRDLRPTGPLTCVEYNEGMIEEGRAACGDRARWIRGDGFRLPVGQVFDLVYAFRFIRHFKRVDRTRLYAEVHRVLNHGGYFALDAVNERVSRPLRQRHPEQYPLYDELYTAEGLRNELQQAGFEVTALEPMQKYFRWQYRSQVFLGRANWLNRFVIRALERLPRRDGLEWVVICRRV